MLDDCHLLADWQAQVVNTAVARARSPVAYKLTAVSRLYDPSDTVWENLVPIEHDLSRIPLKPESDSRKNLAMFQKLANGVCKARVEDCYGEEAAAKFDIQQLLGHFDMEKRLAEKLKTSEKPENRKLLREARQIAGKERTPSVTHAWLSRMRVRKDAPPEATALEKRRVLSSYLKKWSHVAGIALCKERAIRYYPYSGVEVLLHLSHGSIRELLRIMYELWRIVGRDIQGFLRMSPVPEATQARAIRNAAYSSFTAIGQRAAMPLSKSTRMQDVVTKLGTIFDKCQSWPYVVKAPETASLRVRRHDLDADRELAEAVELGVLTNALVMRPDRDNKRDDMLIGLHPVLAPKYRICYRNPFYYPHSV